MMFPVNVSCSPVITSARIVEILEQNAAEGEWVRMDDRCIRLSGLRGDSRIVMRRHSSSLDESGILAVDPLYGTVPKRARRTAQLIGEFGAKLPNSVLRSMGKPLRF